MMTYFCLNFQGNIDLGNQIIMLYLIFSVKYLQLLYMMHENSLQKNFCIFRSESY